MKQLIITTFTLVFFQCLVVAQNTYVSNSNTTYEYDSELKRIEIASSEDESILTIDLNNKLAVLKLKKSTETFTIVTNEEFQLEAGVLYKYDIRTHSGEVKKLEINTQKNWFIIKPVEIKAGETSRKFMIN